MYLCPRAPQAIMVSKELIRIAILWHEIWYDALEEASRQYFGARNVEGMFATLAPLHEMMDKVMRVGWELGQIFVRFF
jgi:phosphatidylinositol kinase/protein kinase (PI-3  family)